MMEVFDIFGGLWVLLITTANNDRFDCNPMLEGNIPEHGHLELPAASQDAGQNKRGSSCRPSQVRQYTGHTVHQAHSSQVIQII